MNKGFTVRGLKVDPPVAIAPMVGLSHSAFRTLAQGFGGIGLFFTEMLAAKRLPHDNPDFSPLLVRTPQEYPLIYQLIAGDSRHIPKAIEKLHSLGADGVDLNLGCPAPMQKRQGAGASLAHNRQLLERILKLIRTNTELPLSVKIRIGIKQDDSLLKDQVRFFEDLGVDFITIHARLAGEKFCRKPRWSAITAVKEAAKVPIIANGGIFSVDDAQRCLSVTGADGVMVGRGVIERPWLCAEISEKLFNVSTDIADINKEQTFYDYIQLIEDRFRPEKRLGRLKQFTYYYSKTFEYGHHLASTIQSCSDFEQAKTRAALFFKKG